jgi:hypothetical protein
VIRQVVEDFRRGQPVVIQLQRKAHAVIPFSNLLSPHPRIALIAVLTPRLCWGGNAWWPVMVARRNEKVIIHQCLSTHYARVLLSA